MFSRAPNLHIRCIIRLICGLIILNQSIFESSASSVIKLSNLVPSRSLQQDLPGLRETTIATFKRSDGDNDGDDDKKTLTIKVQREPITLIERLNKARVVRSEKFKDFQEGLLDRLERVRNRKSTPKTDQKDVYKLDINLPISTTSATTTNDNAPDHIGGELAKFESLDKENNEADHNAELQDGSESAINSFYSGGSAINYIGSPMLKLRRALRDVTTGGSVGGFTSSEPLDFSGPITGNGGSPSNHVSPTDTQSAHKMAEQPAGNNNENMNAFPVPPEVVPIHQDHQSSQSEQAIASTGGLNSGLNSDSVMAGTMWPERNNNRELASHRPRSSFDDFGRRNVKPAGARVNHNPQAADENKLHKDIGNENFPEIPAAEVMNIENPFKFHEDNMMLNGGNPNLAAARFGTAAGGGGLVSQDPNRKQGLKVAESYDHTIKCAEQKVEGESEAMEESPKRIEAYDEEEYHEMPMKKIIENHHHHHHHHHHEQKKIIQKEVKKVQQQVQPVHLEIHIKGKTKSKGKAKGKEKAKGKGKGKGKVKAKGKGDVYVKIQNGEQGLGSHEEYKKVADGSGIEDNKSLIGDGESDGGGGGGSGGDQAGEGKRSALADAAPIKSAGGRSGNDNSDSDAGGDEEKASGAKGESETGGSESGSGSGEGESSQDGAASGGDGGGSGNGQQQGQVEGENSGASSEDQMGHVINTSQVPNHYFDIHDHSQQQHHQDLGSQQSSGHEQKHHEGQQEQQQHQQQQVEEEKKAEAQVEDGGAKQESAKQHQHHHEKKHKKKEEKVQQVQQIKQEVKREKKEKHHHHQHQEPKKHQEVVEEKKKVEQPVVKPAEKHVEPIKEEPKKVVEQHQPHKQEDQHKHKQKSKHQHIEVHQHKHFELHKHINLHQQPEEIEHHQIQPHGQVEEGHGGLEMGHHDDGHAGLEVGPLQQGHQPNLNDGYQHQMMGHEGGGGLEQMHGHYEHQHQPVHDGGHHEHQGIPIKEEWIAPEIHEKPGHEQHPPGAIVIEDHSELERHHHQHPMEVGYNEEIIHHPHGIGLTPSAAYKLMGAYSAPSVSHSMRNNTNNNKLPKDKRTGSDAKNTKLAPL